MQSTDTSGEDNKETAAATAHKKKTRKTHQRRGAADLLASRVVLAAVARALELVLGLCFLGGRVVMKRGGVRGEKTGRQHALRKLRHYCAAAPRHALRVTLLRETRRRTGLRAAQSAGLSASATAGNANDCRHRCCPRSAAAWRLDCHRRLATAAAAHRVPRHDAAQVRADGVDAVVLDLAVLGHHQVGGVALLSR